MKMFFDSKNCLYGSLAGADPGGGGGPTFIVASEKKIQVYTFIVASEKKNTRGGCNSKSKEIQKIQVHVYIFMVASEKKTTRGGGGGCNSKS